ncbi:hypothetical protein CEP52_016230 [Fusarium oligoseptatum]|uniref:Uncharacterized protein n=2 Tax=Fusarium solani species complex TaxID=232080 RepID=A0A428S5J5_9HYPO|nr:hypothetical protein CEP52_016230 [Fusarium oligoseptatum]RSM20978.1 hypothetical protein CDV31_000025 [Fusarium ambrosium]
MLFINTILLAVYATIGASAPVLDGYKTHVEHHDDKSAWKLPMQDPTVTDPKHLGTRLILESVQGIGKADKAKKGKDKAKKGKGKAKKGKGKATGTTKTTARQHVRRNNNAQDGSSKIGLVESVAKALGINTKPVSDYLNNLRNDFPYEVQDTLPTCLNQATRQGLSAIAASLSSIPKCLSDSGDEIEIDTDGIEVDADGLPRCLNKAGQDALSSIQNALVDLDDCATATPLSKI